MQWLIFLRGERFGHRGHTHRRGHMMMEQRLDEQLQARNSKDCWQPPEARKRQARTPPQSLPRKHGLVTTLISDFQTPELIESVVYGTLLGQPSETDTPGIHTPGSLTQKLHCSPDRTSRPADLEESQQEALGRGMTQCIRGEFSKRGPGYRRLKWHKDRCRGESLEVQLLSKGKFR